MTGNEPVDGRTSDFAVTLKEVSALQIDRGFRDASGWFFVEGVRNFIHAVEDGYSIERIIFSERLLTAPVARKLVRQCRRSGVPALSTTPEQFRRLSRASRASGIAAIIRQRWTRLEDVSPGQGLCWVLLETVRSPGNLGTLIRSSQAVGGAGFVFIGNRVDPFAPDVVRAAMGAIYQQKFIRADWHGLRRWIDEHKCEVVGATPAGAANLHRFEYPRAPLLVLGEERNGLNEQQQNICGHFVRIPMQAGTDSLNLGVAGSLLMYEVYRNHGQCCG